ncbi:MAG: hypothetical protein JO215_11730 [Ktedonobacteraceae bacterium]|nr:hypothetical protein [Ktedonobacteraceae bacterium]
MRSPFFATLALFARMQITETVPTAATDGRNIFINAAFWNKLTPPERLGLMAHEVLHAALLHVARRGVREPILWNIAADIVVNGMILAQEGFTLPSGHLRNKQIEHLSVEEVYYHLQKHFIKYHLSDTDLLWSDSPDSNYANLESYWRQALQQAQTMARMLGHGTLPANLEREITQLSPSQIDWRSYLWRFLVQTPTDFQSYDRRFIGQGLYLDALAGESVHVYVAIDTSGSIGARELNLFLSEVVGILRAYPHLVASLYYVDAACHGPYPLEDHAILPKPVGGGGTDFRPFFAQILTEYVEHSNGICVYLTDGFGTFPSEPPSLPVLWVLSPGGCDINAIPFGEAVRLIPEAN